MIHNPKMECMDRESMRKLQSERLIKTVKRCYENVPFYKQKMDEMGVKPEDIKSIDDICKLPFTTKHDLRDEYPFGLEAVPHDQVRRIHASSGTTGKPVVDTYTENDLACWAEGVARCMAVADIGPGDTVQVSYGYGLFTGGLGAHDGAAVRGAIQLPTSAGNTEKQIMLMQDFGIIRLNGIKRLPLKLKKRMTARQCPLSGLCTSPFRRNMSFSERLSPMSFPILLRDTAHATR